MNDKNIKKYFENMITWLDENFYGQSLYLILSEKIDMTDEDIKKCGIDSLESYFHEKENISSKTALDDFNDMMKNEVGYIIDQMKAESVNGYYSVNLNDYNSAQGAQVSVPLLIDMLKENKLVDSVEIEDDSLVIYSQTLDESEIVESAKREISQEELEIMCAKHCLWLNDAGGKRANFTNCKLTNLNLDNMNFNSAIFSGAEFEGCYLEDASMCFSRFVGAKFKDCYMRELMAEESIFKSAEIKDSNCINAAFGHSDFTFAKFINVELEGAFFMNSCLQETQFKNTSLERVNIDGVSDNEYEWYNGCDNTEQSM